MKNNNKIYIVSLIFFLVSLFLIVFFIWPLSDEITKNSEDLISTKNDIFSLSAQIKETENFNKNYETYKPNLEKVDQLFVDPNNPVNFIEFLENTAHDSQITSQVSLTPYQQVKQNSINFQVSSAGNFSGILNFLKEIEAGPYLTEIENLTIQNSQGSSITKNFSLKNVTATFSIKVFTKE